MVLFENNLKTSMGQATLRTSKISNNHTYDLQSLFVQREEKINF